MYTYIIQQGSIGRIINYSRRKKKKKEEERRRKRRRRRRTSIGIYADS
jgi:hypothetical protein